MANALIGFEQRDVDALRMPADIASRVAAMQAGLETNAASIEAGLVMQPNDLMSGPMLSMALTDLQTMRAKAEAEGDLDLLDLITAVMDLVQVQPFSEVMEWLDGLIK